MQYITATKNSEYFSAGKYYPILDGDDISGIYTVDDDNKDYYLSEAYLKDNFKCYVTMPSRLNG